jgi:hypothetical protein
MTNEEWGFIRETAEKAKEAGIDEATGLHRTGLEVYLGTIFPNTIDWIHDTPLGWVSNVYYRMRPDYRSETIKLIVEFDGLQHYQNPDIIEKDRKNNELYNRLGYTVVRIPYFIQLTKKAVKTLFGKDVSEVLFNEKISSLSATGRNSPAYLCPAGIMRMAEEFMKFPEQYKTNIDFLKKQNDPFKSGVDFLENEYKKIITSTK